MKQEMHASTSDGMQRTELFIGNLLRYGVLLSAAVIALGICLSFVFPGSVQPPLAEFLADILQGKLVGSPSVLDCVRQESIWSCLAAPNAVVALGLVMLIALPIIRVALTLVVFALQRDYIYLVITAFVLAVLVLGLVFGKEL